MKSFTVFLFLFLSIIAQVYGGSCPAANHLTAGCTCTGDKVSCFSFNKDHVDLTQDMKAIQHGHNFGDQFFEFFELTANKLEALPEDMFQGIKFRQLTFNFNENLNCVDPRAFTGLETTTTRILARNSNFRNISKECNIFKAMSSLINLEIVNITGSEITEIPADAFQATQNNLWFINLSDGQGGTIKKIGERAFSNLRNLKYLDLSYHKITTIERNAFLFMDPSDNELTINLERNYDGSTKKGLNGTSFDYALGTGNRRVTLKLDKNQALTYLKEEAFISFLSNKPNGKNIIDMTGVPLSYCKANQWLLRLKEDLDLVSKLLNPKMVDGEDLWKVSIADSRFKIDCITP